VSKHLGTLGVLFIVWGVFQLVVAVIFALVYMGLGAGLGIANSHDQDAMLMGGLLATFGGLFGCIIGAMAIPNLLAGIGIGRRRKWGRILGIVMGALALTSFPIGTALGIFAMVVLLDKEAAAAFEPGAEAA